MYLFKYNLEEKDYFEFNKFHLLNSPMNKKGIIIYRLLLPVLLALISLVFWINYQDVYLIVGMIIAAIIISVFWIFFLLKYLYSI